MKKNKQAKQAKQAIPFSARVFDPGFVISDHLIREHKPQNDKDFLFYLAGLIQSSGMFILKSSNGQGKLIEDLKPALSERAHLLKKQFELKRHAAWAKKARFLILNFKSTDLPQVTYLQQKLRGDILIIKPLKEIRLILKNPHKIKLIKPIFDEIYYNLLLGALPNTRPDRLRVYTPFYLTGIMDGSVERLQISLKTLIEDNENKREKREPSKITFEINISDKNTLDNVNRGFMLKGLIKSVKGRASFTRKGGVADWKWRKSKQFGLKIKTHFPNVTIRRILYYLDLSPFISLKYIQYLKFRKIYRICQRKENLTKKGLLKILSLWRIQ